jgi:sugar lactone lactonase YvrE
MQSARLFPICTPFLAALALIAATASAQTTAPTTPVGTTSAVQTATLTFTENATVASINVLAQGAPNLDFQFASSGTCAVGTAYTSGQTCTVKYTFRPTHPGSRYGAVALYDNSSPAKAAATTYLEGTGNGPHVVYGLSTDRVLRTDFNHPNGVALDGSGNIFVADSSNNAVKEMLAAGGYTNVVLIGSGFNNPEGVAVDGAGNVFVTDTSNHAVKEVMAADGYETVLTLATIPALDFLLGIAVDGSGNLFVGASNSLWEITSASGYSTKIELCGFSGKACGPSAVAVDAGGNLFIADTNSHRIRKILAASGYTTIQGIGPIFPSTHGEGVSPGGVAVDAAENVFVTYNDAAQNDYLEEEIAQGGYTNTTMLGTWASSIATELALDGSGNVYFTDGSTKMRELDFSEPPTNLSFATTAAGSTSTDSPQTVTVINNGNKPLNISAVSFGHDFPEASGVATDCTSSTTLGISGSCTLSIDFSPLRTSATGPSTPLAEQVTLTDNNLNVTNAEQSVAVSGTETFTPPALTTPTPGTTIGSSSATFTWNPGSATTFQFRLGTTPGSNNIYGSGQTNATSETVSNLPTGVNIYAVLYYMLDGAWKSLDYTYPGTQQAPKLTTPAPGSTLSGSTVTFTWNPGTATTFQFRLGTTLGSNNIYGSGQTTKTSETVSNLPTNGETIHAVLYYMVNGAWQYTAYTYTAQ